jgi:hypothetical protein
MAAIGAFRGIEYFDLNMNRTRKAVEGRTMAIALPIFLAVGLCELTALILANCTIALYNGARHIAHRIQSLFASLLGQQLSRAEWREFRTALERRKRGMEIDTIIQLHPTGLVYLGWLEGNTICIQNADDRQDDRQAGNKKNLIRVATDNSGRIMSVEINGVHHQKIPQALLSHLRACFQKCLEVRS